MTTLRARKWFGIALEECTYRQLCAVAASWTLWAYQFLALRLLFDIIKLNNSIRGNPVWQVLQVKAWKPLKNYSASLQLYYCMVSRGIFMPVLNKGKWTRWIERYAQNKKRCYGIILNSLNLVACWVNTFLKSVPQQAFCRGGRTNQTLKL